MLIKEVAGVNFSVRRGRCDATTHTGKPCCTTDIADNVGASVSMCQDDASIVNGQFTIDTQVTGWCVLLTLRERVHSSVFWNQTPVAA